MVNYEKFAKLDPALPITFHGDNKNRGKTAGFYLHWHEHIELLCVTSGRSSISLGNNQYDISEGDIIIINPNVLHYMASKPSDCAYHCLILHKMFLDNIDFPINKLFFSEYIRDKRLWDAFQQISQEYVEKQNNYKMQIQALCMSLLVLLSREYQHEDTSQLSTERESAKNKMVREAIGYIGSRYRSQLSVDELASRVGFSKYYLCHAFKEITGQTVIDYINSLRCNYARRQLTAGGLSISEAAFSSGFNNLSYFTRVYKRHFGILPSQDSNEQ